MLGKGVPVEVFQAAVSSSVVLASHDNDRKIPRTPKEIFDLNSMLAREMENIFIKKGIPVVPSLGEFTNIYVGSVFLSYICVGYRQ
jgi:repressor of nif and glnA expression